MNLILTGVVCFGIQIHKFLYNLEGGGNIGTIIFYTGTLVLQFLGATVAK